MPKLMITPAQALLKLIKLENDQKKIEYYTKLLVVGAGAMADEKESSQDPYANLKKLINMLQSHPDLSQYEIVADIVSISNDPCVREFQTHLAFETIPKTLASLDLALLERHYNALFYLLKPDYHTMPSLQGVLNGNIALAKTGGERSNSFSQSQWDLKHEDSFRHFSDIQKQKMKHLINIAFLSCELEIGKHINNIPLAIYGVDVFSDESRGIESNPFFVMSDNLGLRRFKDPRFGSTFVRQHPRNVGCYANQHWFNPSAAYPKQLLQYGIAPFINSISGTTLCSLRLMLYAHRHKLFEINAEYLDRFIKSSLPVRTFCLGGHSIQESFDVLAHRNVKSEFASISDFKNTTLNVFYEENKREIVNAALVAAHYTQRFLNMALLHQDIQAVTKPSDIKSGMIPAKMEEKKESKSLLERTREAVNSYHAGSLKRLIAENPDNFARLLAAERRKNNLTELFCGALEMEVDEIIKMLMSNLPVPVVKRARELLDLKCGYKIIAAIYKNNTKEVLTLLAEDVIKLGASFDKSFYKKFNVEELLGKKYYVMLKGSAKPCTSHPTYAPLFVECLVEIGLALIRGEISYSQQDQCIRELIEEINNADDHEIGGVFQCPNKTISTIIKKVSKKDEEKCLSIESSQAGSLAEAKMTMPVQLAPEVLLAEWGTYISQGAEEKIKNFLAWHLDSIVMCHVDTLSVLQQQFSIDEYKICFNKLQIVKTTATISDLFITKDFWISSVDTVSPLQQFISLLYRIENQATNKLRTSRMGYYTMLFFIDRMLTEKNTRVPLRIEILITVMKYAEKLISPKKIGFYNNLKSENQSIILLKQVAAALLEIFSAELPKHPMEPSMAQKRF